MTTGRKRVLISGGGVAGLTAAAAFGQNGWAVDLIERRAHIADAGGVGLTLVGNALRALHAIGVAQSCVERGVPYNNMLMRKQNGDLLRDNPLPRIGGVEWPSCASITRATLHDILRAAATAVSDIRCSTTMSGWQETPTGIAVQLSDGSEQDYALVVVAEGIYSSTRRHLYPEVQPASTGQAVWRAGVPRPDGVNQTQLYPVGPLGVVGVCPVSSTLCYVYAVENDDGSARDPKTLDAQMRDLLADYGGVVHDLAQHITDPATVNFRALEWLLVPRPYGRGRMVIIGDSAHAGPPVLAQGAAMGIEDAVVLADSMQQHADDVAAGLAAFVDRREARNRHVVEASCQLARWEVEGASDKDVVGVMRNSARILAEAI